MSDNAKNAVITICLLAAVVIGCKKSENTNSREVNTANTNSSSTSKSDSDSDVLHSGTGVEKEKPESGKANIQGKVLFNEKPAAGVDVKLCQKFNRFMGCGGDTFVARTDANGEYLIKNVPPGIYEGLIAKAFNAPFWIFASSGIIGSAKYELETDKTFFAADTNLFKNDLKLIAPKAGAKIPAENIEVKWDTYPDAAYYKFSINADSSTDAKTEYDYINKRVDGTSFVLDKPLSPGSYTCQVQAFNSNDVKLSESADDIKFTVIAGK